MLTTPSVLACWRAKDAPKVRHHDSGDAVDTSYTANLYILREGGMVSEIEVLRWMPELTGTGFARGRSTPEKLRGRGKRQSQKRSRRSAATLRDRFVAFCWQHCVLCCEEAPRPSRRLSIQKNLLFVPEQCNGADDLLHDGYSPDDPVHAFLIPGQLTRMY